MRKRPQILSVFVFHIFVLFMTKFADDSDFKMVLLKEEFNETQTIFNTRFTIGWVVQALHEYNNTVLRILRIFITSLKSRASTTTLTQQDAVYAADHESESSFCFTHLTILTYINVLNLRLTLTKVLTY